MDITRLLHQSREGNRDAFDALYSAVYDYLCDVAHRHMRRQSRGHTLSTRALVNEAYLKLADQSQAEYADRTHFFHAASKAMKHILIDYARKKNAQKRGGDKVKVTLDENIATSHDRLYQLIELDDALNRLSEFDAKAGAIVEMSFFGGLTQQEIADELGISERTVRRKWQAARSWLMAELNGEDDDVS